MGKRAFLAFVFVFSQVVPAYGAIPSDVELQKVLVDAKILDAGYPVRVRVSNGLAYVTTYQHRSTADANNDCKIDAVLIARLLLDKCGDSVARVKVHFYNHTATEYKEVTVTAGDVEAFGAQKLSQEKLLASLEVLTRRNSDSAKTGGTGAGAASAAEMVPYKTGPISFKVPKNWMVKQSPDNDTLALCNGIVSDHHCELKITVQDVDLDATLDWYMGMLDEHIWKPGGVKVVSDTREAFGEAARLTGARQQVMMNIGGQAIPVQIVYFLRRGKAYGLMYATPGAKFSEAKPWFDRVLATVRAD